MPRTPVRRTKIVATLGPAWDHPGKMTALLDAGVNVVRINASHGTRRDSRALDRASCARSPATAARPSRSSSTSRARASGSARWRSRCISTAGQTVTFAPEDEATAGEIPTTYEDLAADVRVGARILLDDGLLALEVTGIRDRRVDAVVHYGGELKSHKGMNLPGIEVSAPALTEKDLEDVAQAAAVGVDYLALSFVRRPEDMEQLRTLAPRSTKLVAKIEKDTALRNLCGILDASDAIMVARGDLGVELPFEEVPLMQKQIIREAGLHGKPVITATQMLESMVHAPRPTRAEASDVANAILDGTDAVMLSAETAVGEYPARGGPGDGPDRPGDGAPAGQGRGVTIDAALGRRADRRRGLAAAPVGAERADPHRGRHRGGGLRGGGDAERPAHRLLHQQRLHGAQGRRPAARRCRSSPARPSPTRSASSRWSGA